MLLWCFPRSIAAEGGEEETGFDACDAAEIAHFADVAGVGRGFARFPAGDGALRYL